MAPGRQVARKAITAVLALFGVVPAVRADETQVLCTTFPIYQVTRNVAEGREKTQVRLLLSSSLGCPHDYALTPQDLRKIEAARILVVNGLGLESFLDLPALARRPGRVVIDSSGGPHAGAEKNPHLFASPRLSAQLAANIAAGLTRADPEGASLYAANTARYTARMEALAAEFAALGKKLRNRRVVLQHEAFDYLAREIGLETVAVLQLHDGQEPSAAELLRIVGAARTAGAGAVFTEPQYSVTAGRTLARELGIPAAVLDPGAAGPEDAPLDHYDTVMRRNLEVLRATLGIRK